MGIFGYLAIWLIIGLIHGLYLFKTEIKMDQETFGDQLFLVAFATACGPIGVLITLYQLITEPRV